MHVVRWLVVVEAVTLFIIGSRSSPVCEVRRGHQDGEVVRGPREPKAGQTLCHKRMSVLIVTRRCESRYCCGKECGCLGDIYTNVSACSSTSTELSCFVEHKEIRPYLIACCSGYRLNNEGMCVDIDECDPNPCEQGCRNFEGGFSCYCVRGYQISSDGRTCLEDPKCDNRCAHKCAKVSGKYRCICRPTYVLGEDGASCHPITRCRDGNDCDHICTDTETGFQCSCRRGYRLNHDGVRCDAITRCRDGNDCDHICTDTETGFQCSCRRGYRLNHDGVKCDDINECVENTQLCEHECQNTIGGYHCYCEFGFRLNVTDGRSCIPDVIASDVIASVSSQAPSDVSTSARPRVIVAQPSTSASSKTNPVPMLVIYVVVHAVCGVFHR